MRTKTILLSASIITLLLFFGIRPPHAAAVPVSVFLRPAVQTAEPSEKTAIDSIHDSEFNNVSSSWLSQNNILGWLDRFWIFDRHEPTSNKDAIVTVMRLLLLIF